MVCGQMYRNEEIMNEQTMTDKSNGSRPHVHNLMENPISGEEIESRSFQAIDDEADSQGFTPDQWIVARRIIHTTADFTLLKDIKFSSDVMESASAALRNKCSIYVDSNMIRAGVSEVRLRAVNGDYSKDADVISHIADKDVAEEAKAAKLPRSLFAARKAKNIIDGGIALIGNAPVALMEINRMIVEENIRPAAIIGVPVGFVHVVESKEELMASGAPYISIAGRRGGSPIAVSILHSLCAIANGN